MSLLGRETVKADGPFRPGKVTEARCPKLLNRINGLKYPSSSCFLPIFKNDGDAAPHNGHFLMLGLIIPPALGFAPVAALLVDLVDLAELEMGRDHVSRARSTAGRLHMNPSHTMRGCQPHFAG